MKLLKQHLLSAFLLLILLVVAVIAYCVQFIILAQKDTDEIVGPKAGGALLICGGGSIPDEVRKRFVDWAGGKDAKIVVIPAFDAAENQRAADRAIDAWEEQGVANVQLLAIRSRDETNDASLTKMLGEASGVWISGGDQSRLSEKFVGTEVERQLKLLLARGGVVGGSSAGAAIMTRVMIANGREDATELNGFDLLPDAVIDQHFLRRNRAQRLMTTLARHSDLIGFGIDERTALQVRVRDFWFSVLGESYVMAFLPQPNEKTPRIQILKRGDRVNLVSLKAPSLPLVSTTDVDATLSAAQGEK